MNIKLIYESYECSITPIKLIFEQEIYTYGRLKIAVPIMKKPEKIFIDGFFSGFLYMEMRHTNIVWFCFTNKLNDLFIENKYENQLISFDNFNKKIYKLPIDKVKHIIILKQRIYKQEIISNLCLINHYHINNAIEHDITEYINQDSMCFKLREYGALHKKNERYLFTYNSAIEEWEDHYMLSINKNENIIYKHIYNCNDCLHVLQCWYNELSIVYEMESVLNYDLRIGNIIEDMMIIKIKHSNISLIHLRPLCNKKIIIQSNNQKIKHSFYYTDYHFAIHNPSIINIKNCLFI